jgi:hypothetical protein
VYPGLTLDFAKGGFFIHPSPTAMRRLRSVLKHHLPLILCVFSFGCTKKQTAIVVDDWWNVDYAKSGCEPRSNSGSQCIGDPVLEVRDFEAKLDTVFASDPSCQGVVFVSYRGPNSPSSPEAARVDSKAEWQLMMDFNMGETSQSWSMVRRSDWHMATGTGTPQEIIHTICAVAKQVGGSVVK